MNAPGRYCLTRCYCGRCPQYAEQIVAAQARREAEYAMRVQAEANREADLAAGLVPAPRGRRGR